MTQAASSASVPQGTGEAGRAYTERLTELLRQAERGEFGDIPAIAGWRYDVGDGRSVGLSVVDNKLGSTYGPPSARDGLSGSIYLVWSDGARSNSNLDRRTLDTFAERLQEWRASSYQDAQAAEIQEPKPANKVAVYDSKVAEIVTGDTGILFAIMQQAERQLRPTGVEFLDAGSSAGMSVRFLRNSKGLDLSYPSTSFGFSVYADSLYGNGYSKHRICDQTDIDRVIADVADMTAELKKEGSYTSGQKQVILDPGVAESFWGTYIASNISGSGVANKQAAFSLDDFRNGKQVMRPDLSLVIDGTRDYEPSSSIMSSEGIPGGKLAMIDHGKLVTPSLDVKYAGITGYAPTPGGGLFLIADGYEDKTFKDLYQTLGDGLLVFSVLGMHTQDSTTGIFSLTASQALVIADGKPQGKVKATLSGNFFDIMQHDSTGFGYDPHEENPALLMTCRVTVE